MPREQGTASLEAPDGFSWLPSSGGGATAFRSVNALRDWHEPSGGDALKEVAGVSQTQGSCLPPTPLNSCAIPTA